MAGHGNFIKFANLWTLGGSKSARCPHVLAQIYLYAENVYTLSGHCRELCDPMFSIARWSPLENIKRFQL